MEELRGYDYRIEPADVDFTGRATIMAVGSYICHAAAEDANRHGFGVQDLNQRRATWVLTRFAIESDRMPKEYERLRISTWVSEINRIQTTRNFIITDAQGETIIKSVTNWSMLDIDTRHAIDLRQLEQYNIMTQNIPSPIETPRKLLSPENPTLFADHRIAYSDLDFNRHANTIKYLSWVVDLLPLELLAEGFIRRLDMNFLHETLYGQLAQIAGNADHNYEISANNTPACRIRLEF